MKKHKNVLSGLLISTMTLSTIAMPSQVMAKPLNTQIKQTKQTEQINQLALTVLSHGDLSTLTSWDTDLGTFTQDQANEIKIVVDELIKDQTTQKDKAKAIYTWVVENVHYAGAGDVAGIDPYDVFTKKIAVCGGFSRLYKAMLNLAGIASTTVAGNTPYGAHEWNAVYADGAWFFSDTTFGIYGDHSHFDKSLADFSKEHSTQRLLSLRLKGDNQTIIGFHDGVAIIGIEKGVKDVVVPEMYKDLKITSIAGDIFNQTDIETLKVSKNIETIDSQSAHNATKLKTIEVAQENKFFTSRNGALLTKDLTQILHYPINNPAKTFTIPKEVTGLDTKETFDNPYLEAIEVEKDSKNFTSYDGAVYTKDLKELLIIPNAKKTITILGSVQFSPEELSPFNSKEAIENVIFNQGITSLPADLFVGCKRLKTVEMPESLTTIDNFAFNQDQLKSITIIAKKGTAAHQFAIQNNVKFIEKVNQAYVNLQAKITEAEKIDTSKYTAESVKALNDALTAAKALKETDETTVLVNALNNLNKAISDLVEKPTINQAYINLQAKITEAEKIDTSKYTAESVKALNDALTAAKALKETDETTVLVNALNNLNKAISDLVEKPTINQAYVNLQAKITEAEKIDTSKYTAESVKALNDALTAAKALKETDETTVLVNALNNLNKAIDGLVKKPSTTTPQTGDPTLFGLPIAMISMSGMLAGALKKKRRK